MITSTHPPAADPESKLRPARYGIAIAGSALVIVALITSSILNYVFLDSIPGRTSFYGLLAVALITLGTFILVRAYDRDRATRRVHLIRAAVLIGIGVLLWLLVIDVFLYTQSAGPGVAAVCALACLPTTAFGLWVVRRMDRNHKEPWRLVLVAAAWGAGVAAGIQWYGRQVLGLFFGHATYTAYIGAGVGIARQLPSMRMKVMAIGAGFIIAIAGHFSWDAWATFFPIQNTLFGLVEIHLRTLIMTGPFTAGLIALLLFGIRYEGQNLLDQIQKEAATGQGAILPQEVPILASPWQRLRQRLQALNRAGPSGYLRVSRLQTAQLDLAMERWHRERKEIDTPLEAEQHLRERVIQLRHWVAA